MHAYEYLINLTEPLKVQLHLGADVADYIKKLSHYTFDAGVVELNKGITVRELLEDAVLTKPVWLL